MNPVIKYILVFFTFISVITADQYVSIFKPTGELIRTFGANLANDQTISTLSSGEYEFKLYNIALGTVFLWNVKCIDKVNLEGWGSENYTINVTNVTSYKQNYTILTNASVIDVAPYITQIITPGYVDLTAGSNTTIWCNATIEDDNGYEDISGANATIYSVTTSYNSPDNNRDHYTNNSCECIVLNDLQKECRCAFSIRYYAINGTWICRVNTYGSGGTNYSEENFVINPLTALDLTNYIINYGNVGGGQASNERELVIKNIGNVEIDLDGYGYAREITDGYAMNCSDNNNISANNERYSFTPVDYNSMNPLGTYSSPSDIDLNLTPQVDETESNKTTYWRIYVPDIVSGICKGHIVLIAKTS